MGFDLMLSESGSLAVILLRSSSYYCMSRHAALVPSVHTKPIAAEIPRINAPVPR